MKSFGWRLLPLLLLTFLYFLAVGTAQDVQQHDANDQHRSSPSASLAEPAAQADDHVEPSGAERVWEAVSILRKIKTPASSKLSWYNWKPKGALGSGMYYAKEAFILLFMSGPQPANILTTSTSQSSPKLSQPLSKAVSVLQEAAKEGNPDAIYLLAEMNFHGNWSHPVNYEEAFQRYLQLADLNGNSTAQFMLGLMYATGLNPAVPTDQAKSMLYHTFAAEQDDTRSQMTLAYRSHAGIATARNCDEAVHWYKKVADKAVDYYRSGPPGGHALIRDAYRLADEDGGIYGEGASVSSAGARAKQGGPTSDAYASIDDVLEFLHMQSSKGDLKAKFGMARLHYDGSRGLKRDLKQARENFMQIARLYWSDASSKGDKTVDKQTEKLATKSAGYIGRMFLRGEGTEQSFPLAKRWFDRGVSNGDALSQYSLGIMYLYGLYVEKDIAKAADYLKAAADQDLAVAQTNLGILFLDQGDTRTAAQYFELAAQKEHIEAFYYLAEMNNYGIGRDKSCGMAAVYYKIVAEKAEPVWSSLHEANEAYEEGDRRKAFIGYLMAAEQGSENAQANVAYLLDQSKPRWSIFARVSSFRSTLKNAFNDAATALLYLTRSAKQNNIDSLVKMGDYYLLGLGTGHISHENAAACYQAAAETLHSAQAMWNLGWMHENGLGIDQDFHLAKRFYDQAMETNKEAYFPVKLSLWKLRWRSWWNRVTKGGVHDIEDGEEEEKKKLRSFAEWVQAFLEADAAYLDGYEVEADDWDSQYEHMPGGDDFYLDDDFDDGFLDLLLIGGLIAILGWLLYYRQQQQRIVEQRRRAAEGGDSQQDQQQQQQPPPVPGQQPDGGFFPQPGDPEFNAWLAGGIGP